MIVDNDACETSAGMEDAIDPAEVSIEQTYQEWLFTLLARKIATFPEKQRVALLIDLANRMCFDTHPTPLQQAFLQVGIRLQEYQQPGPRDPVGRNRHASLVSQAYKRLAHLLDTQEDDIAA
jgi:hypothetical protein